MVPQLAGRFGGFTGHQTNSCHTARGREGEASRWVSSGSIELVQLESVSRAKQQDSRSGSNFN